MTDNYQIPLTPLTEKRANEILNSLRESIDTYGAVDFNTYFQLLGLKHLRIQGSSLGWDDLSCCKVYEQRDGSFGIGLPAPKFIKLKLKEN